MRKKIEISKKELIKLYQEEKRSKYEIGKICGCSFKTILNRLREYKIEPIHRSIIQSKYLKNNFSGNQKEKAYILGFRLGDLNVYKTTKKSKVVIARCNTTSNEQVNLIEGVFSKYGRVSVSKNRKSGTITINCFLNDSFDFIVEKKDFVPDWIKKNNKYGLYFLAGYVDAEGSIGVYDGRARFKIDSYDKNTIFWIHEWCLKNGIKCPNVRKIGKKGQLYDKTRGYRYGNDLWRINVNKKESLLKLLKNLKLVIKHKKRKKDSLLAIKNINDRNIKN